MGMKHNYSCGSLAAAEQLEALMRHAAPPGSGCCGMMLGSEQQGIMSQKLRQQFVNGGAAPMQNFLGNQMGAQSGVDPAACNAAFGSSSHDGFSQALDRIDFSQGALPILMRGGGGEPQRSPQLDASGFGRGALGSSFASGGVPPGQPMQSQHMQNVASPLSMLYHGANAALGHNQVASSPVVSGDQMDGQQKRRFVWSPELHSRFEAAVNALGLDAAKPKSILRLMNVEGLTKANIKSHLQKYRCLMQKRASSSATTSQPSTAPVSASGEAARETSPADPAMPAITMCAGSLPGVQSCMPSSAPSAASGSATCANMMDLSALSSSDQRQAALPDAIISQGGCSLQRNLEVQEMTLKVQMDLQEELSRQLQLQKRLQTEMECMMNARAAEAKAMDESSATSSKMNNILALKHKLQHELQAHLRMQHQLLSQLNQVVLPVIGGDAMPGGAAPLGSAAAAAGEPSIQHDIGNDDGEEDGGEDDDDDDDDDEDDEGEMGSAKRPKLDR